MTCTLEIKWKMTLSPKINIINGVENESLDVSKTLSTSFAHSDQNNLFQACKSCLRL